MPQGLDRRIYALCVLFELKNSQCWGYIWVQGARRFKDFNKYTLSAPKFALQRNQKELGITIEQSCN
jgi:hypothetical protein